MSSPRRVTRPRPPEVHGDPTAAEAIIAPIKQVWKWAWNRNSPRSPKRQRKQPASPLRLPPSTTAPSPPRPNTRRQTQVTQASGSTASRSTSEQDLPFGLAVDGVPVESLDALQLKQLIRELRATDHAAPSASEVSDLHLFVMKVGLASVNLKD
eukprot:TRINITY_DN380_c1_g1_i5.p1 TRINITY_DN380_c1_g1~~TRINITY_DN380_c1_g1_i5.p1  ORF type:complete len:154 (-),score=25.57 TRINITY_DN380_c1_g1_i5:211-672(-)